MDLQTIVEPLIPALKKHLGDGVDTGSPLLTLPEHVLEVRRVCTDANSTVRDVEALVMHDPAFAGYLLQLANSVLYGYGKDNCRRVGDAICRLGVERVGQLALVYVARQFHQSRQVPGKYVPLLQRNWLRSWELVRGASEQYWARRGNSLAHHFSVDISDVVTSAVLYFTGGLALITVAAIEHPWEQEMGPKTLEQIALKLNHRLLPAVFKYWGLDPQMATSLAALKAEKTSLCANDFLRLTILNSPSLEADVMTLTPEVKAQWLARLETLHMSPAKKTAKVAV